MKNESMIHLPDEQMFNTLKIILNDFDQSIKAIKPLSTITPCELQTIIDLQIYKSIPLFIQILLDGFTLNKSTEATNTKFSSTNTTIHWEKIDQYLHEILIELEQSYNLLFKALEETSFEKHSQSIDRNFLDDFSGNQSILEFYSIYTEFISYIYSFYLAIKSILASLFNKTSLLIDSNENRVSTSKKSKKKVAEQQSVVNESESEMKLWNQLEKIEILFHEQWMKISDKIRKYEGYLRLQGKLTDEECERLEKELDGSNEQQSNK